jgi:GxxExxY protein
MRTDEHGLKHHALTSQVIRVFFQVYNELGAGFLESVYVEALNLALSEAGLSTEREMPLAVTFRGHVVGKFRADLVVESRVLVEAKACPQIHPTHEAQVLNYLRATILEVGLVLNFGARPQFRRLVFDNELKKHPQEPSRERGRGAPAVPGTIRSHPCSSVASPLT